MKKKILSIVLLASIVFGISSQTTYAAQDGDMLPEDTSAVYTVDGPTTAPPTRVFVGKSLFTMYIESMNAGRSINTYKSNKYFTKSDCPSNSIGVYLTWNKDLTMVIGVCSYNATSGTFTNAGTARITGGTGTRVGSFSASLKSGTLYYGAASCGYDVSNATISYVGM